MFEFVFCYNYQVKNMTHLLLDLDTSDHNFDADRENSEFYQ